jgi:hypothetical protein
MAILVSSSWYLSKQHCPFAFYFSFVVSPSIRGLLNSSFFCSWYRCLRFTDLNHWWWKTWTLHIMSFFSRDTFQVLNLLYCHLSAMTVWSEKWYKCSVMIFNFLRKYVCVIQAAARWYTDSTHLVPCAEELGMLSLSDYNYLICG